MESLTSARYSSAMAALEGLGEALVALRKASGVTLRDLARRMGYADKSSVRSLEAGNPTADKLGAYLDAVGSHSPLSARPRIAAISEELAAARRAADAEAPLTQQDRDALLAAGRVELARRQGST